MRECGARSRNYDGIVGCGFALIFSLVIPFAHRSSEFIFDIPHVRFHASTNSIPLLLHSYRMYSTLLTARRLLRLVLSRFYVLDMEPCSMDFHISRRSRDTGSKLELVQLAFEMDRELIRNSYSHGM